MTLKKSETDSRCTPPASSSCTTADRSLASDGTVSLLAAAAGLAPAEDPLPPAAALWVGALGLLLGPTGDPGRQRLLCWVKAGALRCTTRLPGIATALPAAPSGSTSADRSPPAIASSLLLHEAAQYAADAAVEECVIRTADTAPPAAAIAAVTAVVQPPVAAQISPACVWMPLLLRPRGTSMSKPQVAARCRARSSFQRASCKHKHNQMQRPH